MECLNRGVRDELFAREIFDSIVEAEVLYENRRQAYDRHHLHGELGFQRPAVSAKAFTHETSHSTGTDRRCPQVKFGEIDRP